MKHYKKTFEDVYSSVVAKRKCALGSISIRSGMPTQKYIELMREVASSALLTFFDSAVKLTWYSFQYSYGVTTRKDPLQTSIYLDHSFYSFVNNLVGVSPRPFMQTAFYGKIVTYFKDFFPDFEFHDPVKDPEYFKYPYKHVTPDFLLVVYQMPERLEFLAEAEKKHLTYAEFVDLMINWTYSYNEEAGRDVYIFMKSDNFFPYIKYVDHIVNTKFKRKTRKKL